MGLLTAGSGGCCLRWPATVSGALHREVGYERHGRCALVSVRCPRDVGEVLRSSGHDSLPVLTDLLALLGLHLRAAVVSERVARVPFWCVWVVAPDELGIVVSSGGQFQCFALSAR